MCAIAIIPAESDDVRLDPKIGRLEADLREAKEESRNGIAELKKEGHEIRLSLAKIIGQIEGLAPRERNAFAVTVASLVGSAILLYLGWIGVTLYQQGVTLSSMRQSLYGLGITLASSDPASSKSQADVKAALAEARKSSVPVPKRIIEQAGHSFIAAAQDNPGVWDTALDLVSYRSSLNTPPTNLGPLRDMELRKDLSLNGWPIAWPGMHLVIGVYGYATSNTYAIADKIEHPIDYAAIKVAPPMYISFRGNPAGPPKYATVTLDGMRLRHVILRDLKVVYKGGGIQAQDVIFVNCTFDIAPRSTGVQFAEKVLTDSQTTFSAGG